MGQDLKTMIITLDFKIKQPSYTLLTKSLRWKSSAHQDRELRMGTGAAQGQQCGVLSKGNKTSRAASVWRQLRAHRKSEGAGDW